VLSRALPAQPRRPIPSLFDGIKTKGHLPGEDALCRAFCAHNWFYFSCSRLSVGFRSFDRDPYHLYATDLMPATTFLFVAVATVAYRQFA
jgi:hypothetical protein